MRSCLLPPSLVNYLKFCKHLIVYSLIIFGVISIYYNVLTTNGRLATDEADMNELATRLFLLEDKIKNCSPND